MTYILEPTYNSNFKTENQDIGIPKTSFSVKYILKYFKGTSIWMPRAQLQFGAKGFVTSLHPEFRDEDQQLQVMWVEWPEGCGVSYLLHAFHPLFLDLLFSSGYVF